MAKRLRILHLSDLHMGQERGATRWRLRDVLGQAWRDNLDAIAQDRPVDLVCFTGDLAFSGKSEQYREAGEAIEFLLHQLKLDKSRFFCVPGNHDIDRDLEADAWRQLRDAHDVRPEDFDPWIAGGRAPRGCENAWIDAVLLRRRAYDDWLTTFGLDHFRPQHHRHGRLGYRITFASGELGNAAPLHIVGFDSAWLAGDGDHREQDNANLRLTREQVGRLLSDDNGDPLTGHAIGLIHHPFSNLIENESQSMPGLMSRMGLGLLLHGHLHDLRLTEWASPRHGLHISSAGSQYQRNDVPNTIHLLDLDLSSGEKLRPVSVWVRAWSSEGFWHDDNSRYAGMRNGRLQLLQESIASFTPTPGTFVGRTDELDQLRAALLPAARGADTRPTVICCAIDGMPGVGKTRLAEEFITEHWLQAYPPPADTPSGECVLRLVLSSGEDQTSVRSADALLRDLADRLKLIGQIDDIRRDLPSALQRGPGGHPRLVLIENVDSDVQAEQVAALVHGLPGCPVLVTARVRKFGGQAWKRVEVEPLLMEDAIKLLCEEAKAAGDDAYVPDEAQARQLAETLGRLPLALHIAASHLGLGKTPNEFLDELRATGLDLAPAQYGDHGLQVDRARAILRSSFDLSWKAWCTGAGKSIEWQQALVALAHGPAEGVGESLGAAITNLPQAQYGRCLVAAGRLSLLEIEWVGEGEARERRVRLHALIAEFLRTLPQPDAETVIARMGAWFAPRVSDANQDTMGNARREVQSESSGLLRWLDQTRLDEAALSIVDATHYASANGPYDVWLVCLKAAMLQAGDTKRGTALAWAVAQLARQSGDLTFALETLQASVERAKRLEDDYVYAVTQGQIADILQSRGELEEALCIRRDEQIPVFERLGVVRERAITQAHIAGILQSRGELEEALRIRCNEVLPLFQQLADPSLCAVEMSKIADILQERGELEEALRIRREEVLPVAEQLGDVRSSAITKGKIAYILQSRGDLEEALRIRREEELPVYERLGDVHSLLVGRTMLAFTLVQRGRPEDRPEALALLKQALSEAERLRLSEVETIRGWIAQIFGGGGDDGVLPS
jgi:tetratricopeptide (TPR) repeat protein